MKKILFALLGFLFVSIYSSGQTTWNLAGNAPLGTQFFGTTNATDIRFRTANTQRMVLLGTGNVGFLGLGTAAPVSLLHLNTSATGDVFRSDGPTASDNRWQLLTGGTERFRIRTLANGYDTYLERTQVGSEADIRLLTAEVQVRARNKRLGDFCEMAGALADEVIMGDGSDVNFTALSSTNRRLFLHGTNGFLGLGSLFAEAGIVPNYHFHINESTEATPVYQQFTNGTSGNTLSDGLRIGLNAATSYEIRSFDNGIWLDLAQSDTIRMRFRDIVGYTGLNGINYGPVNRIMVPLRAADANVAPMSMMQLGTNQTGSIARNWMNVGTTYATNLDAMYVGWMERANGNGGPAQSDAVISWGCQRGVAYNSPFADNFRIIFLEPTSNAADSAGTVQGKEVFRIEPFSGNAGIGNYSVTGSNPPGTADYIGAKLDIDGDLRVRSVLQDDTLNQVLVRDPNDLGRVKWRNVSTLSCEWNEISTNNLATGYSGACHDGNVAVGTSSFLPGTKVTVVNSGLSTAHGVQARVSASSFAYGVSALANSASNNYGIYGEASTSASVNYGIAGRVSDTGSGNYAVYGFAPATNANTWAGYFNGRTFSPGAAWTASDENLKSDIGMLEGACDILSQIQIHTYQFNNEACPQLNLPMGPQVGVLAQELQEVMPNSVTEINVPAEYNNEGDLIYPATNIKAVNYGDFVPMLIKANQELLARIDNLEAQVNSCCNNPADTRSFDSSKSPNQIDIKLSNAESIVLNQNVPNPFAEQTTIQFNIDIDFSRAQILFYDGKGKLIQTSEIKTKGSGQINVFADDLTSGIYSYVLVVDGKIIDTKKMVKK